VETTMNSDKMIHDTDAYGSDILVRLSTITKGPLLERRKEIRRSFVYAALSAYQIGSEFEVNDLSTNIKSITKCELGDENIISILNQLKDEGVVQHVGGLKYKIEKNVELPESQQITQPVWDEFLPFLKKQYTDYDRYIDKDARSVFDAVLFKLLTRFEISSRSLESQIESLPIDNFKLIIEEIVKKSSLSTNLSKKYTDIIYLFIVSKSPNLLKLIFKSYSGIINIDLLIREQEIPSIDFLDYIKFLIVDTPVLVALMCGTDPAHPLASAVAKQCERSKIPLYYAPDTKKEMWNFIAGSKHEMGGLSKSKTNRIIRSQFVSDFRKQNISWGDYIATLNSWELLVKSQWQIVPAPEDFKLDDIDDDFYYYVKKNIHILDCARNEKRITSDPNYKPRYREDVQIEHDARCLGAISHIRGSLKVHDGKEPMGPWFLTFDNLVSTLDALYPRRSGDFGFVFQPRTLLNYLLVYSKMEFEEEDQEAVAEAIIKFTARTPDPKLTTEEYTRLITYKIGLGEDDVEVMKEIFLASPLLEELKNALELEHEGEADRVAYRIITDTPFVNGIIKERKTQEKLKRAAKAIRKKDEDLRETKEKLSMERAAREALERTAKQNIYITTNVVTNIDVNIQNQVDSLISLLDAQNAFKDGLLEKPSDVSISTKEKLKNWLETTRETIETSMTISDGVRALVPLISYLLGQVGGA